MTNVNVAIAVLTPKSPIQVCACSGGTPRVMTRAQAPVVTTATMPAPTKVRARRKWCDSDQHYYSRSERSHDDGQADKDRPTAPHALPHRVHRPLRRM
jgi:hypothetical protein